MGRLPDNFADLVEQRTLLPAEADLLAGKRDGASRLACALLLKFYGRYGRFPRGRSELKSEAVEFVAAQVKVPAADLGLIEWDGRTVKRHRAEIRRFFGFREFTVADGEKLTDWLAGDYALRVRQRELVREQFLSECRTRQVEPPTPIGRPDRGCRAGAGGHCCWSPCSRASSRAAVRRRAPSSRTCCAPTRWRPGWRCPRSRSRRRCSSGRRWPGSSWVGSASVAAPVTFGLAFYGAVGLPPLPPDGEGSRPGLHGVLQGLRFVVGSPTVRGALLTDLAATVLAMPISLFPLVNAERFGDNPRTLGLFLTAVAVGGVCARSCPGRSPGCPGPVW